MLLSLSHPTVILGSLCRGAQHFVGAVDRGHHLIGFRDYFRVGQRVRAIAS